MQYSTFKALMNDLCAYIILVCGHKEDQIDSFLMVQSHQMSGLPVQLDGFLMDQHTIL